MSPAPSLTLRSSWHRAAGWSGVAAGLFAATYVLLAGRRVVHTDEAWFLWVSHRVANGDVLYRDVYSVTTPIPTWVAAVGVWLFGAQLVVVRALSAACFVGSTLVGLAVAKRCGLGPFGRLFLVVALLVYASPAAHFVSVYSQLAVLMALIALWCVLGWIDSAENAGGLGDGRLLVGAGVASALSFGSKPNVGLFAFASVALVVAARARLATRSARLAAAKVLVVSMSFAGVVVAIIAPVLASGGFDAFLADVVGSKPGYVRLMGGEVPPGSLQVPLLWSSHAASFSRFQSTQALVVLVAVGVLVWTGYRARPGARFRLAALALFTATAMLAAYPQAGPQHLTEVMPLILIAMGSAIPMIRPSAATEQLRRGRLPFALLPLWLSLGAVLLAARAAPLLPDALTGGKPPHFAGTAVTDTWPAQRRDLTALRQLTGGHVFIVRSDASFYYLAGRLEDPTPYDFAARSDFGASGEQGVIDTIEHNRVRWVCIHTTHPTHHGVDVRPLQIEHEVREELRFVARLNTCDLYRPSRQTL